MENKKEKRGGAGRGQGRKKIRYASMGFRADEDVFKILAEQENRTEYINQSVRFYNKSQIIKLLPKK